jgi:hypothetical protein
MKSLIHIRSALDLNINDYYFNSFRNKPFYGRPNWYSQIKIIKMKTFIRAIKITLALPIYPLYLIMWILKQVIAGIDFLVQKHINLIKKMIK